MSPNSSLIHGPDAPPSHVPLAARLPKFVGGPADAVERLTTARLGVVACGSVGIRIAKHLAHLQPAGLLLIDPSLTKPESTLTYDVGHSAVGQAKALLAADACRDIHPGGAIAALVCPAEEVPLGVLAGLDGLFCASDNLPCEVHVGDAAQRLGLPLVMAAVDGPTLSAQVRVFANAATDGPCPACAFNDDEWRMHDEAMIFSCAGRTAAVRTAPTMSVSHLCSTAADLAVNQWLRLRLGLGSPVADTLIAWSGFTHRTLESPLDRNSRCRCCHARLLRVPVSFPPAGYTIGQLGDLVRSQSGKPLDGLEVEEHVFVEEAHCRDCGRDVAIGRFVPAAEVEDGAGCTCPRCGAPPVIAPFYRRRFVPISRLPSTATLAELGAAEARGVLANMGESTALIYADHRTTEVVS